MINHINQDLPNRGGSCALLGWEWRISFYNRYNPANIHEVASVFGPGKSVKYKKKKKKKKKKREQQSPV